MNIPSETVLWVSIPFLVGQVYLYQVILTAHFSERFKKFEDAAKIELSKKIESLSRTIAWKRGSKKESNEKMAIRVKKNVDALKDAMEELTEVYEVDKSIDKFRYDFEYIINNVKYTHAAFVIAIFGVIMQNNSDPSINWSEISSWAFVLGIVYGVGFLGWKTFELNAKLSQFESGEDMTEILDRLKEEAEEE